jgi:multiple sugar transport system substrate-binding protein
MKKSMLFMVGLVLLMSTGFVWAAGSKDSGQSAGGGPVTIEFLQWWQPEMPAGSFERAIESFHQKNPAIKVNPINLPFAEVLNQVTVGGASGTLSDVVGIEPSWLDSLIKQNTIEPLDAYIKKDNWDLNKLSSVLVLKGQHWNIPITTFYYSLFYNTDMFAAAGLTAPPKNRSEFLEYARKLTVPSKNQYGWGTHMSLDQPTGARMDFLSWYWVSQKSVKKDERPNLDTQEIRDLISWVGQLYSEGLVSPGAYTKKEAEKVEEFANGRIAMMVSGMAHVNLLRKRNPNLKFDIAFQPVPDGFTGRQGATVAAWTVGLSKTSKYKNEGWELIKHLLETDVNAQFASSANAFPGNRNAKPDFVLTDPTFAKAFELFQNSDLWNELWGSPNGVGLQRAIQENLQSYFEKKQTVNETSRKIQEAWVKEWDAK